MSISMEINDRLYRALKKFTGYQPVNLFNTEGKFVEVFPESEFNFLIPIGLFSSTFSVPKKLVLSQNKNYVKNVKTVTLPKLYPLQNKVILEVTNLIRKKKIENRPIYITLHLACGFGKTITTCYLIASHKRKAVICVPNKMLIQQWKAAVETTNINYIVSTEGVSSLLRELETKDADILIVVSRHLTNEKFCKFIYHNYDIFILDESHVYNLMNNSAVTNFLTYYPPSICYFLTATPRLSNRIYCNDVVNVSQLSKLYKVLHVVEFFFEPYSSDKIKSMIKKLDTASNKYHVYTEKVLSEDKPRNELILSTIIENFQNGIVNRVLVITKLRNHMMLIYNELNKTFKNDTYLGDAQNKHTLEIVKKIKTQNKFIFVSTMFYSGTGLDIPSLDSLFICPAVMNHMQMEQLLGRVCRETENSERHVFMFPNTSIREIRHTVGSFSQKLKSLALDKLGFEKPKEAINVSDIKERALTLAFNEQVAKQTQF